MERWKRFDMADRDEHGHYVKGVSGNPKGRPKKSDVTVAESLEWAKMLSDGDLEGIIEFFARKATDKADLLNLTLKLMQYILPKKQSVQANVVRDSTLTVRFLTDKEAEKIDYAKGGTFDAEQRDGTFYVDPVPPSVSGKKKPVLRK